MITQEVLDYFGGNRLSAVVWVDKYQAKGEKTPVDTHHRLAREFYRIEEKYVKNRKEKDKMKMSNYGYNRKDLSYEDVFNLFDKFKYVIAGGSVNAILGTNTISSLSNCFLGDLPKDDYRSIMNVRTQQSSIGKMRGGFGTSLELLRPKGAKVNNSAGTSTGSFSFIEGFSEINNEIAQEGRRGALMLSHHINHPDVEEFALYKQSLIKGTGANLSIKVTDEFMEHVKSGSERFIQTFPHDRRDEVIKGINVDELELDVLYPGAFPNSYIKVINPQKLWKVIIDCAWGTAEPGVMFETKMKNYAPEGVYPQHEFKGTNPCGEVPLSPLDSCRLMSLNLSAFVVDPYTDKAHIDEELLYVYAYELSRIIDNLVDLEVEAVERIINKYQKEYERTGAREALEEVELWTRVKQKGLDGRRTGQGITGLGDMFAMLGFKYDSDKAVQATENVMRIFFKGCLDSTIDMAIERGPFNDWDKTIEAKGNAWYDFVKENFPQDYERMMLYGRRNISFGSVAPQGSGSQMSQTTSGIEPVFEYKYERAKKLTKSDNSAYDFIDEKGEKYKTYFVLHTGLKRFAEVKYPGRCFDELSKEEVEEIYRESPYFESSAAELDWRRRLDIQAIVQKYICMSISITVNLKNETTKKEIEEFYTYAHKAGVKGTTLYRDGCRNGILNKEGQSGSKMKPQVKKRPKSIPADIHYVTSKGVVYAVTVGLVDGLPYEVFAFKVDEKAKKAQTKGNIVKVSKKTYEFRSDDLTYTLKLRSEEELENVSTIMTSLLLREGTPVDKVVYNLEKSGQNITSFTIALSRVLRKYIPNSEIEKEKCPECGGKLVREEGCIHCSECSYSKC